VGSSINQHISNKIHDVHPSETLRMFLSHIFVLAAGLPQIIEKADPLN
jgi:hypothetical protein